MNLFIDTNVFLDFYHLSGEGIEELHKLTALLGSGDLKLFVPLQLCDEFRRNRDNKINDALSKFRITQLTINFPAFCKLYPEYTEIQEMLKVATEKYKQLSQNVMRDIEAGTLKADELIEELFRGAVIIEPKNDIFNKAFARFHLGNPPGKDKGTIGDELIWETLLDAVPNEEDLALVSSDNDYASAMDKNKLNPFLAKEWTSKKGGSSILFYKSIGDFSRKHYPHIRLASDVMKNTIIDKLATSASFAITHVIIKKLAEIDNFSPPQVEQLVQIAKTNKQVSRIMSDDDVFDFYVGLMQNYDDKISTESVEVMHALINEALGTT